jgi:hypothetical protein
MFDIAIINIAILGGVFVSSLFWIVRAIRKDRKEDRESNPTYQSNI